MSSQLKLSSPWVTFYHEVDEMFKLDSEIKTEFDEDKNVIKLYVNNSTKADALTQILPTEKTFGNVSVRLEVIPANYSSDNKVELFKKAFEGNEAFSYISTGDNPFTKSYTYVVFKNKVVQFFNDDLCDVNGMKSTLYQDIANDIFINHNGIFFCTDHKEK